jgi:hypothetical protein
LRLNLAHQRQPGRRHPGPRQSRSRPLIGLPIHRQLHQLERHDRRPPFDCCSSGRLERRGSSRPLKFPFRDQLLNAAMRLAPPAVFHRQSPAWGSVTLDRTAKLAISPSGFDRCKFSRREKRRRSHFAPAIIVHPFCAIWIGRPRAMFRARKTPSRGSLFREKFIAR